MAQDILCKLIEVVSEEMRCAKTISLASNRKEEIQLYWEWADPWRDRQYKGVKCLEKDLDGLYANTIKSAK